MSDRSSTSFRSKKVYRWKARAKTTSARRPKTPSRSASRSEKLLRCTLIRSVGFQRKPRPHCSTCLPARKYTALATLKSMNTSFRPMRVADSSVTRSVPGKSATGAAREAVRHRRPSDRIADAQVQEGPEAFLQPRVQQEVALHQQPQLVVLLPQLPAQELPGQQVGAGGLQVSRKAPGAPGPALPPGSGPPPPLPRPPLRRSRRSPPRPAPRPATLPPAPKATPPRPGRSTSAPASSVQRVKLICSSSPGTTCRTCSRRPCSKAMPVISSREVFPFSTSSANFCSSGT